MRTQKMKSAGLFLTVAYLLLTTITVNGQQRINLTPEGGFPEIKSVEANGSFTLVLVPGEQAKLEAVGNDELPEDLNIKVSDRTLIIKGNISPRSDLAIVFTYNELRLIKATGAAVVKTESPLLADEVLLDANGAAKMLIELKTSNLISEASGASELILSGEAATHQIKCSGASGVNAYNLVTQSTQARVSGAGNVKVNAVNQLSGEVSGAGEIRYKGAPENLSIEKSGAGSLKQVDRTDTTKIRLGSSKVIIIDDEGGEKKRKVKRPKFDGHWGGVELGMNALLTPDRSFRMTTAPIDNSYLDLKLNKSIGVAINLFESNFNLISNHLGLVTGLGLEFTNYRFGTDVVLMGDSSMIYHYRDTLNDNKKSRLRVTHLNIPLILEFQTNSKKNINSFHIGVGVIGGLRIDSYTRLEYLISGKKQKVNTRDDYHLNPFKYEATARVGWGHINLFANYALSTLFEKGQGPELYPITLGISLVGW